MKSYEMLVFVLGVVLLSCLPTEAQELTEREKKLMDVIESLEKRISALEDKVNSPASPVPSISPSTPTAFRVEPVGNDIRVHWKEGLRLDSNNGDFKLKFGGRIQHDWGHFSDGDDIKSAIGDSQDGMEFRRARLFIGGTIYDEFSFKAQYDLEDGVADVKDMWIAANKVPILGTVKVGHFKEPFGLENLTSSKDITFMERSLTTAFSPARNSGIGFSNHTMNKRLAYALGVFREVDAFGEGQADSGHINATGRISGVPIWNEDGDHYLHIGTAVSIRNVNDQYGVGYEAEAHMAEDLVFIPDFTTDGIKMYGAEAAYVKGPWSVQGEYVTLAVDADLGNSDAEFDSYYIMGSYFLTGEHRRYKLGTGAFDKVKPNKNFEFGEGGGPGAWELAARLSHIDLEDADFAGGELTDITLGVNWYLNPNMRVTFNYIHGELEDGALGVGEKDDVDYTQARFQVTW